jgi:hypothetical protein
MNEFLNSISTREIAILFWGVLSFGILLYLSKDYKGFGNIIKLLFSKILIYWYIFIGTYISLLYFLIKKTFFWESYLIKDFVLWSMGFALISFFNSNKVNSNLKAFSTFKSIFSITIFTDFFINFFTFDLGWELVLIPIVTLIGVLKIYTDLYLEKEGYAQTNNFLNKLLAAIGLFLFCYCIHQLYYNYSEILDNKTIKSFLLPVILSIVYFPIIVFFGCIHKYENLFNILNGSMFIHYKRKRKIKMAIIIYGNFNIDKLNRIKNWDKNELKDNSNIFLYINSLAKFKSE